MPKESEVYARVRGIRDKKHDQEANGSKIFAKSRIIYSTFYKDFEYKGTGRFIGRQNDRIGILSCRTYLVTG